jgi:hypothetical protein
MLVFVCMFIFWIYLPKTWGLCLSEPGLLHLTWCLPIACTFKAHVTGWEILHCVYIPHFLDPFISCRHLGYFDSLAIMNRASWTSVYRCLCCTLYYVPLGRCPGAVITGSLGSSIFSFLRNLHTAFYNGSTNLHSHWQCIKFPVLPYPHQHLLLLLPLIMAILAGMRWNLSVILICISFIAREIKHFFMYLLAICTSSLRIPCSIHMPISSLLLWELSFSWY